MKRIYNFLILLLLAVYVNAQENKELMLVTLSNGEVVTYNVNEVESITFEIQNVE